MTAKPCLSNFLWYEFLLVRKHHLKKRIFHLYLELFLFQVRKHRITIVMSVVYKQLIVSLSTTENASLLGFNIDCSDWIHMVWLSARDSQQVLTLSAVAWYTWCDCQQVIASQVFKLFAVTGCTWCDCQQVIRMVWLSASDSQSGF